MQRALVELARQGDQEAFASLAKQHISRCYALAFRIIRDQFRAQDVTQQALIKAWRDLPNLRDPDRFDAWLSGIVVHACYDELRARRRWDGKARELSHTVRTTPDVASAVADRDALELAFRLLTPEHRAVVVLHHHLGYPLTEIASSLGIPVGTARSRLHYAVRQLRAALDSDESAVRTTAERLA